MQSLTYRTDDSTRWGTGYGSDLPANVIDLNFWALFGAVDTLENNQATTVSISYFVLVGDQLYIHMSNHSVQGPFTVPHTVWNPRGNFLGGQTYQPLDVVSTNGALYIINVAHTSVAPFDPNRTDGNGHNLYSLLLEQPQNELPSNGTPGQRLVKSTVSPYTSQWISDRIRMNLFIEGSPQSSELLFQHLNDVHMTIPAGLEFSIAFSQTPAAATSTFNLFKNLSAPIGTITFAPSPLVSVVFPSDVPFVPGDIVTMVAPAVPDVSLANISFNIVGLITAAE